MEYKKTQKTIDARNIVASFVPEHKGDEKGKKRMPDNKTAFSIDKLPKKWVGTGLHTHRVKKREMNSEREEQK